MFLKKRMLGDRGRLKTGGGQNASATVLLIIRLEEPPTLAYPGGAFWRGGPCRGRARIYGARGVHPSCSYNLSRPPSQNVGSGYGRHAVHQTYSRTTRNRRTQRLQRPNCSAEIWCTRAIGSSTIILVAKLTNVMILSISRPSPIGI